MGGDWSAGQLEVVSWSLSNPNNNPNNNWAPRSSFLLL